MRDDKRIYYNIGAVGFKSEENEPYTWLSNCYSCGIETKFRLEQRFCSGCGWQENVYRMGCDGCDHTEGKYPIRPLTFTEWCKEVCREFQTETKYKKYLEDYTKELIHLVEE